MLTDTVTVLWDLTQEAHPLQSRYKPKLQAHWAALIQRDPAILHATICVVTSNDAMRAGELPIRDPNQKRSQLVVDTFHHRGETIRLVNEGLSDPVKASSDSLIAAVSSLLTIEVSTVFFLDAIPIHFYESAMKSCARFNLTLICHLVMGKPRCEFFFFKKNHAYCGADNQYRLHPVTQITSKFTWQDCGR